MPEQIPCLWFDGQAYTALNGGPQFPFTEAVSFQIVCADQEETDRYWHGLIEGGGEESMCGWLEDRFGATQAMLQMRRIDIAEIRRAADA